MIRSALGSLCLFFTLAAAAQQPQLFNLMPVPSQFHQGEGKFRINSTFTVLVKTSATDTVLVNAVNRAYQTLNRKTASAFRQAYITPNDTLKQPSVQVSVRTKALFVPGIDESYTLTVSEARIDLAATNTVGALRGLQTLIQLCQKDGEGYYFPFVSISDRPRFTWRGLMIDAARHFVSIDNIKRNLDAMAAVKMNVFHWHLTDDEGFRVQSNVYPRLQGNGANGDYYTQVELKDIVKYAADRGIMVVPEFDMPGHAQSWFAGYPELASQAGPFRPGPRVQWQNEHPDPARPRPTSVTDYLAKLEAPTFDATNEKVYAFLDKFIAEMTTIFPGAYIHIGADENNGVAWKRNPRIASWMKSHRMEDTDELQRYFVARVYDILKKHKRKLIGWEEILHDKLPKDAIVHMYITDGGSDPAKYRPTPSEITGKGYQTLVSGGFYLDLFMPAYIHYNNPVITGLTDDNQILGGEAAQWTEMADNTSLEGRIWPRAGAVAERLWSPASVTDVDDMYRRLFALSHQLDEQGLQHISNYERALRRLSNNQPIINQLKVMADLLTPVKGFRMHLVRMNRASNQTSPLTELSDMVFVDSELKRKFRSLVKNYLETGDKQAESKIRGYLNSWKQNDAALQTAFSDNVGLTDVKEHSKNLSLAAAIGLQALEQRAIGSTLDSAWGQQMAIKLTTYAKPRNGTELAVIPEILALVSGRLEPEPAFYSNF